MRLRHLPLLLAPVCFTLAPALLRAQSTATAPSDSTSPGTANPSSSTPPNSPPAKVPPKAPPAGVEVLHDVVIGTGGSRPLHAEVAYPTNPARKPMPAVIFIHGGGWEAGNNKSGEHVRLAQMGYFGANVEYRLTGEAKWPAQIEDVKLAVRWLRANAEKYGVDPNRIGVWGVSAGGHLVSCLGTMGDEKELEGTGGYPGVSSKVQAVVDFCGPVDFTPHNDEEFARLKGADHPLLVKLFGANYHDKPDVWKQGSPAQFVKPGDPPFLIVHGDKDETVPYSQAVKMEAALQKASVPCQFITVVGGNHGMAAPKGEPAAHPNREDISLAVLTFLDKYLKQ